MCVPVAERERLVQKSSEANHGNHVAAYPAQVTSLKQGFWIGRACPIRAIVQRFHACVHREKGVQHYMHSQAAAGAPDPAAAQ